MGYRHKLGRVPKDMKEKFKGMSSAQVELTMGGKDAPYRPPWHEQLYEIGKGVEYEEGRSNFYDFNVYDAYETEFDIISKEGLKAIIQSQHEAIGEHLNGIAVRLVKGVTTGKVDGEAIDLAINYVNTQARMWGRNNFAMAPYYLDEAPDQSDGNIVKSWDAQYAIFNLVYIYRTFDWVHDYLIYSAW